MVLPEDRSVDAGRHEIHETAGRLLVGGVDFLTARTALLRDTSVRSILNSQQSFEAYLEFRDQAFKIAAAQMVSMSKSPDDLFSLTKDDAEKFEPLYAEYLFFQDLKPFLGDESDDTVPSKIPNCYNGDIKRHRNELLRRLYSVRRYFVYRKGLLKVDFIQWDSDLEEVIKKLKSSTRWSELGDCELKRGLKSHMDLLKEFAMSEVNCSKAEFENIALEKINLEMGSEVDKRVKQFDNMLINHYFNRMKLLNLARECSTQAQEAGTVLVEEAIPLRAFSKSQMLTISPIFLRFPNIKQTMKQAFESSIGSLQRINEQFQRDDDSSTRGDNEELIYDPMCGMSKEEFEWRYNQFKVTRQRTPQVLHELKTHSQRVRQHFLANPKALQKWDEYEDHVRTAFASNLQHSLSSPLNIPDSVKYKHLMKRKAHSKTLAAILSRGLDMLKQKVTNKRVSRAGATSMIFAAGVAVGSRWWY